MKIRLLCIFCCCLSVSLFSSPLRLETGWKLNTPKQGLRASVARKNPFQPAGAIYFDDHRPSWALGWGVNLLLSDVYYFDPDNGSQGSAVSESNFGVGLLVCGGMNVPIATFNENAGIGLNLIPSLYGGLGYVGFNAPATIMIKYGQGATHYFTSDWCFGVGGGYGISAVQYFELYHYAYAVSCPFIIFEVGYDPAVLRFEIFERRHTAKVPPPNSGEFMELALRFIYYFEDKGQ